MEGGGRCLNCQHNTKGINCNECVKGYFRPTGKNWNEIDVCQREFILFLLNRRNNQGPFE